jgi:hypothetical protein
LHQDAVDYVLRYGTGSRQKGIEGMNEKAISLTQPPEGYANWLGELKNRLHRAQQHTTLAVNRELVLLYWLIGATAFSARPTRVGGPRS